MYRQFVYFRLSRRKFARKIKNKTGEKNVILFGLSGTGYFDLTAYESYNKKTMTDYIPTDEDLAKGFAGLPAVNV